MEDSNENDEIDLPSINLKMVWRKTRKSFSVRIDGRSYVYRSLNRKTKMVLLRCGYPSCNAAVKFDLESYWISLSTTSTTKKSDLCSMIDIDRLVLMNPTLDFQYINEHKCGMEGDEVKSMEQAIKNQVQKLDKDVLISSRYDHLLSKAITNLEQDSKLDDTILAKTSTRRLKQFCADVSGRILIL